MSKLGDEAGVNGRRPLASLLAIASLSWVACASPPSGIAPVGFPEESLPIDLSRFMGDWYVIAHIPLPQEADAHEAIERYEMQDDGMIDVLFTFCDERIDGPLQEYTMRAWVYDEETNAEWRVRPFWPLSLGYQIVELDPDYRETVVVNASGYAWIMAREMAIDGDRFAAMTTRLEERGFDTSLLRNVPHDDGRCSEAG